MHKYRSAIDNVANIIVFSFNNLPFLTLGLAKMQRRRHAIAIIVTNLFIFIILNIVILGILEIYLRLSIPPSSKESIFEYSLESKRYKVMKKNAKIYAWGVELRTNDLGFRDNKPTIPPKGSDEFRIIVLGDSFTVSAGVDYDFIYTSLLEKSLKESFPRVKIINLAVGGYNPIQYKLVLEEVGKNLNPDMILVSVFPENDFSMDTYNDNYRMAHGMEKVKSRGLYTELYVYRAYLWRLEAILKRIKQRYFNNNKEIEGKSIELDTVGWKENLLALESIRDFATKNKLKMIAALLPTTWSFEKQRGIFDRIEDYCKEINIHAINLLEPFIESKTREKDLRLNLLDSHPNEKYNRLVAKYLAPHIAAMIAMHDKK